MTKLIAKHSVIVWAGFGACGSLALAADAISDKTLVIALWLAIAGLITGLTAYMQFVRSAETGGSARKSNQRDAEARHSARAKGTI
ncbi:hypothetical protein ACFMPD_00680 [Sedimentitalea sp. HM32M-2]|uniref:hypothetical protein n=1 Tax=Sedimentitalea sp. HM32M-2 TaxID=3351566 RepID=UPI0036444AA1